MIAKQCKLHQHLLTKTARNTRDGEQATTHAKQMVRVLLLPWNLKVLICGSVSAWSPGVLGSVSHGLYCEPWRHQKRLARPFPDFVGTMGQESCEIQSIMEKETAKASAGWRVCQLKRKSVPVMRRKEVSSALRNLRRENQGLGRRGKLNDARMGKL